ncbi:recombinase family protein [Streptosporangium sp. NPDC000396]|uniref:recombinase family protein n=1 Tax=Streptosporangium sp. NPDC000396 TaxID=3366185 RepID=UPI00369B5D81
MADRIYLRHSTDKQTDARQRHALAALLAIGAPTYEDPATSSRQLSLDRAGFTRLLHEAAVGDTIRITDAARLFRTAPHWSRAPLSPPAPPGLPNAKHIACTPPASRTPANYDTWHVTDLRRPTSIR